MNEAILRHAHLAEAAFGIRRVHFGGTASFGFLWRAPRLQLEGQEPLKVMVCLKMFL